MARATFDGPVLQGDTRFGPFRDVGYSLLKQAAYLDFSNNTVGTAGYSGASSQFVTSNNIPNVNATVYTPSTTVYPPVANVPTADAATAVYRGVVFYVPVGSTIDNINIDVTAVLSNNGTTPAYAVYIGNNFATAASNYATMSLTNSAGSRSTATYSATQLPNAQSTLLDIPQANQPSLSQVVVTFAFTAASGTISTISGKVFISLNYTQADPSIGSTTAYPYGNFD